MAHFPSFLSNDETTRDSLLDPGWVKKRPHLPSLRLWLPLTVLLALAGGLGIHAFPVIIPFWLAGLILATLLILVLHFSVAKPAARLLRAADRLARGESAGEIQIGGVRELSGMADTLNQICRRVRANMDDLRLAATAFETHEAIVITDPNGRVLRVNRAFSKLTGYTAEEVLGRDARRLLSRRAVSVNYRQIQAALREQDYWEGDIWKRRKQTSPCLVWLSITAVRDENGKLTHFVGATLDLSDIHDERAKNQRAAAEEHAIGELLRLAIQPVDSAVFL